MFQLQEPINIIMNWSVVSCYYVYQYLQMYKSTWIKIQNLIVS